MTYNTVNCNPKVIFGIDIYYDPSYKYSKPTESTFATRIAPSFQGDIIFHASFSGKQQKQRASITH